MLKSRSGKLLKTVALRSFFRKSDEQFIGFGRSGTCNLDAVAQPEGVLHDFCLLLEPILLEPPSWFERIIVTRPWHAVGNQIPITPLLGLPNVYQFVDQQTLTDQSFARKIIAIVIRAWVEMQMPARCHGDAARLKGKPLSPSYRDQGIVDRISEDCPGQSDLAFGQAALPSHRALRREGVLMAFDA